MHQKWTEAGTCELRITTFANVVEIRRTTRFVKFLLLLSALFGMGASAVAQPLKSGDPGFGWQWVRQNPFTIQAASVNRNTWDFMEYVNAGFTILQWDPGNPTTIASRPPEYADMSWHGWGGAPSSLPGQTGWLVADEPTRLAMVGYAGAVIQLRKQSSESQKVMYATAVNYSTNATNLFGSDARPDYTYSQYLDDLISIIKPDVLMFDNYPFFSDGTTWSVYLQNLMMVREKAQGKNLPYWGWLQAYGEHGRRTPSESDHRFNVYTHLTMGFTGFSYWAYDWSPISAGSGNGMLDSNGNPLPLYNFVKKTNGEIAHLGKSLRFLKSTDVRFIPGRNTATGSIHATPTGLTNWASGAGGEARLVSVSVNTALAANRGANKDGLIGFFEDDNGDHYFMLTNLNHRGDLSAEAAKVSFILNFNDSVDRIWRLNSETGNAEEILLSNHSLTWMLTGGSGDLFKYDNPNFVSAAAPSPGDFNSDGDVDDDDLSVWRNGFSTSAGATLATGDADGDADVDGADFLAWQSHFAAAPSETTAIPEPQSAVLLSLSGLVALYRALRSESRTN